MIWAKTVIRKFDSYPDDPTLGIFEAFPGKVTDVWGDQLARGVFR